MPVLNEPPAAGARRVELRAGERLSVSSSFGSEGDRPGILRTSAILAMAVLAGVGVATMVHTMGLKLPF